MLFTISAIQQGKKIRLQAQAQSAEMAGQQVRSQGLTVLSVQPVLWGWPNFFNRKDRFPLGLFCQDLVALLNSGLSLPESLAALGEKEERSHVRVVVYGVRKAIESGESLSLALSRFPMAFPTLLVATVKASERTGNLVSAIQSFSAYLEKLELVQRKMKAAAVYPLIVLSLGLLVSLFLLGFVTPRFASLYAENLSNLPWASRMLMEFGLMIESQPIMLLVVAVSFGCLGIALFFSPPIRERFLQWVWSSPGVGRRLRTYQLARFYRSVGMLLESGIPVPAAMDMAADVLQRELQKRVSKAKESVRGGRSLSQALDTAGLTTPVALRMMQVGEKSGRMADMLQSAAEFHDQESARSLEAFTRLFEPLLMVLVGLLIGLIVILLYIPIFDLAGNIQ
jgi:general secretion pathway protein F